MDLLAPYHETEKGNQYVLTVMCMLKNYVFMIPIRSKSTEEVINAYLAGMYSTFRGSKYILSDRGSEFTSKQFTWLANELGLTKVCPLPYTATGNLVIDWTHTFLKASVGKPICNHHIDRDEIANIATMTYNVFSHSSAGAPIYLMFGCNSFMLTYLNYDSQNSDTRVMKNVEFIWMPCEKFIWWQYWTLNWQETSALPQLEIWTGQILKYVTWF